MTDTLKQIVEDIKASRTAAADEPWRGRTSGALVLFAGAPGTGKSIAARAVARELGLDLYRIDLSRVVSKYIGETEKNLRQVFEAAENGGALLLFDEAGALFKKRSTLRDARDRYANMEIADLLQGLAAHSGIAILSTNRKDMIDAAFLRRLRLVVEFPRASPLPSTQACLDEVGAALRDALKS